MTFCICSFHSCAETSSADFAKTVAIESMTEMKNLFQKDEETIGKAEE